MKSLLFSLIIFCLYANFSHGQKWGANTNSSFKNEAFDVEVDLQGNTYVVGYISGSTTFGQNNSINTVQGPEDAYIAKYNPQGSLLWVRSFGGLNADRAYDLALDASGNAYFSGQFFGQVQFGSFTLNSNSNSKDIFISKISPSGSVIWAIKDGGQGDENVMGLTLDTQGNLLLTGQFKGQSSLAGSNFSSRIDPNTNLPSFDLFVSKYTNSGIGLPL
jgi:hypothetical protein